MLLFFRQMFLTRARVYVCVVHWHCTAQLSMFNMEKRFRNKIIIIIIVYSGMFLLLSVEVMSAAVCVPLLLTWGRYHGSHVSSSVCSLTAHLGPLSWKSCQQQCVFPYCSPGAGIMEVMSAAVCVPLLLTWGRYHGGHVSSSVCSLTAYLGPVSWRSCQQQCVFPYCLPGAAIMETDDRQLTTVFTVQPSCHHRHSTNPVS